MLRATTKTAWRSAVLAALLCGLLPAAIAQSPRPLQTADEFTVAVVTDDHRPALPGDTDIDLGRVSYNGTESQRHGGAKESKSFSIVRHIRVRVARRNNAAGILMVSVYLLHSCYPCKLRLDGFELKSCPTVVMMRTQLYEMRYLRLILTIPASSPIGDIARVVYIILTYFGS